MWESYLPLALMAYQATYHSSIRRSPFEMIYGRRMILPGIIQIELGKEHYSPDEYMKKLTWYIFDIHKEAYFFKAMTKISHHN